MSMPLLAIAGRDLRGAIRHLRIFLLCVMLGVASIAAVGLVIEAASQGIAQHAGALLGGDLVIKTIYQPIDPKARAFINARAKVTEHLSLRTMVTGIRADGSKPASEFPPRVLAELKAVEPSYPLRGVLRFEPAMTQAATLGSHGGRYGAAVEHDLLVTLGLRLGDTLMIGTTPFEIRAELAQEPDRLTNSFSFGPHVMIAREALAGTGLVQWGSMLYYRVAMLLPPGTSADAFEQRLRKTYDDGSWEISDLTNAAPGLRRAIDRLGLFLGFASVATLLIGGVGIAGATGAYFQSRLLTIARLKCLGAARRQIIVIYLCQLLAMTTLAVLLGLAAGMALEYLLLSTLGDKLPVPARPGLYSAPLGMAAAFGYLVSLAFGLPALLRASRTRTAMLLRDAQAHALPMKSAWTERMAQTLGLLILLALTVRFTGQAKLSIYFALATFATFIFFRLLAALSMQVARRMAQPKAGFSSQTRLSLANIARPGGITQSVMLSLGLGSSLMVTIALVSLNFHRQLTFDASPEFPAFFLIDIPHGEVGPLKAELAAIPGVGKIQSQPMLRGRISAINSRPVDPNSVAPEHRWALSNERGISYAETLPEGSVLTEGAWWPAHYQGPALVSFVADLAHGLGVKLGDTMTLTFLGRSVTAKVANLREVNWSSLQMNFSIVLTPGAFGDMPVNDLATVQAEDAAHGPILRLLAERYPTVTVIRLKDALRQVAGLFDSISSVVLGVAAESLMVGVLVIFGALSASLEARRYEMVLLKVLGQTRADVRAMLGREMLMLVLLTLLLSLCTGSAIGYLIGRQMMLPRFLWSWQVYAFLPLAGLPLVALLVTYAARRMLSARPLEVLRNG